MKCAEQPWNCGLPSICLTLFLSYNFCLKGMNFVKMISSPSHGIRISSLFFIIQSIMKVLNS